MNLVHTLQVFMFKQSFYFVALVVAIMQMVAPTVIGIALSLVLLVLAVFGQQIVSFLRNNVELSFDQPRNRYLID